MWVKKKHEEFSNYLTRILSGHGLVGSCKKHFTINETETWAYCPETDKGFHTVFVCWRWRCQRDEDLWRSVRVNSLVSSVLKNPEKWAVLGIFFNQIMKRKKGRGKILRMIPHKVTKCWKKTSPHPKLIQKVAPGCQGRERGVLM